METTKFIEDPTPGPLLRSQAIIYGLTILLTVGLLVLGGMSWWTHRHDPQAQVDPNSFRGGLSQLFETWKRDVLHSTPAPVSVVQVQPPTPTPAQVAQVQQPQATAPTATPYQATDAQMAEWTHIPPGQEANYEAYRQRLAAQQPTPAPTPFPTPYLAPEVASPDPVAAKHAAWKTMRDAYAQQQLVRARNAKTDAEKGQIQREIALWRQNNPEPPKAAASQNPDEIPIH